MGQYCPQGQTLSLGLCYAPCSPGYYEFGGVCYTACPAGFTNTGTQCEKPGPGVGSYGRGWGHETQSFCEQSSDHGARENGCEEWGLLWYPKCDKGFHNVACCVCSIDCPPNFTDSGIACTKGSYINPGGIPSSSVLDDIYYIIIGIIILVILFFILRLIGYI